MLNIKPELYTACLDYITPARNLVASDKSLAKIESGCGQNCKGVVSLKCRHITSVLLSHGGEAMYESAERSNLKSPGGFPSTQHCLDSYDYPGWKSGAAANGVLLYLTDPSSLWPCHDTFHGTLPFHELWMEFTGTKGVRKTRKWAQGGFLICTHRLSKMGQKLPSIWIWVLYWDELVVHIDIW